MLKLWHLVQTAGTTFEQRMSIRRCIACLGTSCRMGDDSTTSMSESSARLSGVLYGTNPYLCDSWTTSYHPTEGRQSCTPACESSYSPHSAPPSHRPASPYWHPLTPSDIRNIILIQIVLAGNLMPATCTLEMLNLEIFQNLPTHSSSPTSPPRLSPLLTPPRSQDVPINQSASSPSLLLSLPPTNQYQASRPHFYPGFIFGRREMQNT